MSRLEDEKAYLKRVIEQIKEEREKEEASLERIPLDYKGRYSDTKWGDEDLVDKLTKMCLNRLRIINGLENNPYFGSFDFTPTGGQSKRYYIGKTDILDGSEILVLDWRNPICTLYYDQSIGPVSYKAPNGVITGELTGKSQIIIKDGEINDIKDVDLVSDDELLQPYLSVHAESRMKVIIASIQAEQNSIIREAMSKNIIVQGVAGSGKTSVALHRIAYLLYNSGNKYDANKFVIIGPNKYFLNYVSSILPDLDAKTVEEYTFEEIAKHVINEEGYTYESSNDEMKRFTGSKRGIERTRKIKGSLEYRQALIQFLNDYFESCIGNGARFGDIEVISGNTLKEGITPKIGYPSIIIDYIKVLSQRIKGRADDLYYELYGSLMTELKKYEVNTDERKEVLAKMDDLKKSLRKGFIDELKKLIKPLLISPISLYKLFLENIESYISLSPEELQYFKNETLGMLKKKTIPYDDMAAISFLTIMYRGNKDYEKYKQVVIDEAQDYNQFQFAILKSLFKYSSFSIFGDLAQSIYSYRAIDSWEEVKTPVFDEKCSIINMTKSYRTTKEITEASNLVLGHLDLNQADPVLRTGEGVNILPVDNSDRSAYYSSKISSFKEKGYKSVGIICKTEEEISKVASILQNLGIQFNLIASSDDEYKAGICLLTSHLAKGLEFDGVIINDASVENYKSDSVIDMHLLYVAMTRALHELDIAYTGNLVEVLNFDKQKIKTKK